MNILSDCFRNVYCLTIEVAFKIVITKTKVSVCAEIMHTFSETVENLCYMHNNIDKQSDTTSKTIDRI